MEITTENSRIIGTILSIRKALANGEISKAEIKERIEADIRKQKKSLWKKGSYD